MPVEIIETRDPLTAMVQFRTSPVYEMIVSLHTLFVAHRHLEWAARAQAALGPDFLAELSALYGLLKEGMILFEMPVDYPDHEDVPGFVAYLRAMTPLSFLFYLTGRVISRERLAALQTDPEQMVAAMSQQQPHSWIPDAALREILADVGAFQARLAALWERYWTEFFWQEIPGLQSHWAGAIADKERILAREGGKGLLQAVVGRVELLGPLPDDQPVTELVFTPVFFASAQCYLFYGYGNQTILFDSERTEARISELNRNKEQALNVAKALGDATRLSILRLIADHEGHIHGKQIASRLELSQSAVSRQLTQLRDCGLIQEEHHDDQTVTYRLIRQAISELPAKILDYLYS